MYICLQGDEDMDVGDGTVDTLSVGVEVYSHFNIKGCTFDDGTEANSAHSYRKIRMHNIHQDCERVYIYMYIYIYIYMCTRSMPRYLWALCPFTGAESKSETKPRTIIIHLSPKARLSINRLISDCNGIHLTKLLKIGISRLTCHRCRPAGVLCASSGYTYAYEHMRYDGVTKPDAYISKSAHPHPSSAPAPAEPRAYHIFIGRRPSSRNVKSDTNKKFDILIFLARTEMLLTYYAGR